jgi:CRP-like cAMP-binding protein
VEWQLLDELPDAERRLVLGRMRRRTFARSEVLFHEGDPADTLHFVAEGRVMVRRSSPAGDSVAFRVIGAGRVLGDVALVARDPRRSSTVVALEPTATLSIAYSEFDALCRDHPELRRVVAVLLSARVRRLSDQLVEALFLPVEARLVHRLADLCDEYDRTGTASVVSIPLSQTDVAELAGATRPTANRVLRQLEADGLVRLGRGRLDVVDPAALRRQAGPG